MSSSTDQSQSTIHPITQEPRKEKSQRGRSRANSTLSPDIEETSRLRGLSSLAVANFINIQVSKGWWRCDFDINYSISDGETDALIFSAIERLNCCWSGNLQNILIRDHGKTPVARVCYKDKACCSNKLVMAVYAPADLLVGTVEESTGFLGSSEFVIRNSDGDILFDVEYEHGTCPIGSWFCCGCAPCTFGSKFKVKAADSKTEIGKILEKTNESLRLQFKTKLDITGKIILTGFCIGLIHKTYNQILQPDNR